MSEVIDQSAFTIASRNYKPQVEKLLLIKNLLDALHLDGINYCHWKSNEHLEASMLGNTDLDILFDESQKEKVIALLHDKGFKRFEPIKQKQYKDIEDFIGLDFPSGKIVHVHTHFRLTMGETYLKSYQLNLEDKILASRVFDDTYGIYCSHPAFELILLYFRESLKIRKRDVIRMYLRNKVMYAGNIIREYRWLKERCAEQEMEDLLKTIVKNDQRVGSFVKGDLNRKELLKLSVLIKKEFASNRLFSPLEAQMLRWYREISITTFRKFSRLLHLPIKSQRINPRGGLVVAVIGADGSGKSTVVANLHATFKKKLDVYPIYMGKGHSGQMSWPRKLLVGLKDKAVNAKTNKQAGGEKNIGKERKQGYKKILFESLQALIVANEKKRSLRLMQKARKRGMLVICDRFPQNQVKGSNDGPVLDKLSQSSNPFFRYLSKLEERVYKYAENHTPDIVIKLVADAEVIQLRKPSRVTTDMLEAKIEGIKKLYFKKSKVITVDAAQPLEKVLFTIKKEIWDTYA